MKNNLDRIPTHPAYCLDKLQNAKRGFQEQHYVCQQKIEYTKKNMARKGREINEMKGNLAAVHQQHQEWSKQKRRGHDRNNVAYDDEEIRDFSAKQQCFINKLERDISILRRELKKLEQMSLAASKIIDVMEQEYQQAVLHRNQIAGGVNEMNA
jgi:predicted  nucleic acid-binding Zn-ribbon protein